MSVTVELYKPLNAVDGDQDEESSGDESEWLERGDHPLLNDLILETLFGFVRRCDLKSCRVVSKKWNLHTIPHMRASFRVTIHGDQFHETNIKMIRDTQKIDNFVDLFRSNELGFPFTRFVLGPIRTGDGAGQEFLRLFENTATEIDLNVNRRLGQVHTIEGVSELLRTSPNLRILGFPGNLISGSGNVANLFPDSTPTFHSLKKITIGNDYDQERMSYCPSVIEELLTAVPSASDLVVFDIDKYIFDLEDEGNEVENPSASYISCVLNCIEMLGMQSSIQSLDLHQATLGHIRHLRKMVEKPNGLKLKSLSFEPNLNSYVDYGTIQIQLATIFKDTLEHLHVDYSDDNTLVQFPLMPLLKSLVLHVSDNLAPNPMNLNKIFPVLEALDMHMDFDSEDAELDVSFPNFDPCPTIKSLRVHDYPQMTIRAFHNILTGFPNLTKLDLNVEWDCAEILRQIWTQMTQLESLSFNGYTGRMEELRLDSLFTGIPNQTFNEIGHVLNQLERMSVQERKEKVLELVNENSQLPSIRNLTNLKDLNLTVSAGLNSALTKFSHLTDRSAYLAFYSMNHLRHLEVNRCEFTKDCCEILTKETGLVSWSFRNAGQELVIPPFLLH